MKTILPSFFLLLVYSSYAQCPFPVTLNSGGHCVGDTLKVITNGDLSRIIWYKDGNPIDTVMVVNAGTGQTVAGGHGAGPGASELNGAWRIFVDKSGNLYIADAGNNRVQKWAPGATTGITVAGGNGAGTAANQITPYGLYVDDPGNMYITDFPNDRIVKWAPGATSGVTVAGGNGRGSAANQFNGPASIFVDGSGTMYVTDFSNSRIQKWLPGAITGITVAGGNGEGAAANQLDYPTDAVVDGSGNIYVADGGNYPIQRWAAGAMSGVTVAGGNGTGSGANQFNGTAGLYVDAGGNVYVADNSNYRVQKWAPGATSGITVAGGNGMGTAANQFSGVQAVFVTANGDLYISDYYNYRIQKWPFQSSIDTSYTPRAGGNYTAVVTYSDGCTDTTNPILINPTGSAAVLITASDDSVCTGTTVTFTAHPVNGGPAPAYQWQVNGVIAGANSAVYSSSNLKNKDAIVCIVTSNGTCITTSMASSNTIVMAVDDYVAMPVNITTPATTVCSGIPVEFTASVTGSGTVPVYQWQVNGVNAGANNRVYSPRNLRDGDVITCTTMSTIGCGASQSNSISMVVRSSPEVTVVSPVFISAGESITLNPTVSGDVDRYLWSPGKGLSDSTVINPVAHPLKSTTYTLQVWTDEGCKATGSIQVKVSTPLRIPNAFTPNGDGKNDVFYIMGEPLGGEIRDLSIFNRWGQRIFRVQRVLPGDPSYGWKGDYKGTPAAAGTYVYVVVLHLADGSEEVFKGAFELIR